MFNQQEIRAVAALAKYDITVDFQDCEQDGYFDPNGKVIVLNEKTATVDTFWHECIHAIQLVLNDYQPLGMRVTTQGISEYLIREEGYKKAYSDLSKEHFNVYVGMELEAFSNQNNVEIREKLISALENNSLGPVFSHLDLSVEDYTDALAEVKRQNKTKAKKALVKHLVIGALWLGAMAIGGLTAIQFTNSVQTQQAQAVSR